MYCINRLSSSVGYAATFSAGEGILKLLHFPLFLTPYPHFFERSAPWRSYIVTRISSLP